MSAILVPEDILRDIQFDAIDVKLFQKNILNRADFIMIKTFNTNRQQVEMLFEVLRKGSKECHDQFLEIVADDYNWLRDKCEILLQKMQLEELSKNVNTCSTELEIKSETSPACKEMVHNHEHQDTREQSIPDSRSVTEDMEKLPQALTTEMMSVVKRNHRVVRGWTTLAHVLGMSHIVHIVRMRMLMSGEDMDACILHLLQEWQGRDPKNAILQKLIAALREESYNDVADELEEKFC